MSRISTGRFPVLQWGRTRSPADRVLLVVVGLALVILTLTGAQAIAQTSRRPAAGPIPVEGLQPARRLSRLPPDPLLGLHGQPFAPEGLSGCEEFDWYRAQWGLPYHFNAIAWRESNCRNDESVHTSCCWGYLQLWVALHLSAPELAPGYADCGVTSRFDVDSDTPLDKQRQLCAAAVLFSIVGYSAWS